MLEMVIVCDYVRESTQSSYLLREEGDHLSTDGIKTLGYLSLLVHFHIQAIRHLVILLNREDIVKEKERLPGKLFRYCPFPSLR